MHPDTRRHGAGQALIELLVGMMALVPLFFGMAWVAKVQDMQAATHAAARDLAFECAQVGADCPRLAGAPSAATALRQRHFSGAQRASDPAQAHDGALRAAEHEAFWHDRRGATLLSRYDDVSLSLNAARFSSPLAFAGGQHGRGWPDAVRVLSNVAGPGRFGLDIEGGLFRARVQTAIARHASAAQWRSTLTAMPVRAQSQLAILVDTWAAARPYGSNADSVETRVREGARLPGGLEWPLEVAWMPVRAELKLADWLGLESGADRLRWHAADVDLLPPDRLPPDRLPSAPRRR